MTATSLVMTISADNLKLVSSFLITLAVTLTTTALIRLRHLIVDVVTLDLANSKFIEIVLHFERKFDELALLFSPALEMTVVVAVHATLVSVLEFVGVPRRVLA